MSYLKAATHIEVDAGVRYWEDGEVNDVQDDNDVPTIPFRDGERWRPRIRLEDGLIENWPDGTVASVHYKVCDDGVYWLTDASGARIATRDGYVPGDFLCHGGAEGYGDYIIFSIAADGMIIGYERPALVEDDWQRVHQPGWKTA